MNTYRIALIFALAVGLFASSAAAQSGPPGSERPRQGPPGSERRPRQGPPGSGYDRPGYFVEEFYRIERELVSAERDYRAAPGGSYAERDADYRRRRAYHNGTVWLTRIEEFGDSSSRALESFAADMDAKYRGAAGGSFPEKLYNEARRAAWPAFTRSVRVELRDYGWRNITIEAARFDGRYRAAPAGSAQESAFNELRTYAWRLAIDYLSYDLDEIRDGWELRRLEAEFQNGYRAAPAGSAAEKFYREALRMVRSPR